MGAFKIAISSAALSSRLKSAMRNEHEHEHEHTQMFVHGHLQGASMDVLTRRTFFQMSQL